jgi:type II secretory pathway pseudopilin PulG
VLIAMLLMLTLVGVGALSAAEVWSTTRKRQREADLLWTGEQYRKAIESYWKTTPGPRKILPSTIDQLLDDNRFPNPVHHLRKAYTDPMTDGQDFELIKRNNALVGVKSTSAEAPLKVANFPLRYLAFQGATDYTQWEFVFTPPLVTTPAPSTSQPTQPPKPYVPGQPTVGLGLGRH